MDGTTGAVLKQSPTRFHPIPYSGIAFRPGDENYGASEKPTATEPDRIAIVETLDAAMPGKVSHIELKGHPLPVGIAFSPDGTTA